MSTRCPWAVDRPTCMYPLVPFFETNRQVLGYYKERFKDIQDDDRLTTVLSRPNLKAVTHWLHCGRILLNDKHGHPMLNERDIVQIYAFAWIFGFYPLQDYAIGLMLLILSKRQLSSLPDTLDYLHDKTGPQSGMYRLLIDHFIWWNCYCLQRTVEYRSVFVADVIERLRAAEELPTLSPRIKTREDWVSYTANRMCRYHAHAEIHAEIDLHERMERIFSSPELPRPRSKRTSRENYDIPAIRRTRSEETFRKNVMDLHVGEQGRSRYPAKT